ncbi:MAG: SDR family NAD(P)-dependent oxidoreductase [Saccharofermentanales bacterium]
MDLARWNRTLEVNVTGYMLMCKYVVPHMKEAGYGKIVMMASADAFIGEKNPLLQRNALPDVKGAVVALVQSLGCYLAQFGITVNASLPGTIRTDQSETTLLRHQWFVDHYESKSPQNRFGNREEIIGTVIYLSSDASSHTVGRVIITTAVTHSTHKAIDRKQKSTIKTEKMICPSDHVEVSLPAEERNITCQSPILMGSNETPSRWCVDRAT